MYQTASYTEPNVSVSVVDRFATEPVTAVQVAGKPLSEEELDTLFEQAMNDRVLAFDARLSRSNKSLITPFEISNQRTHTTSVESFPSTIPVKLPVGFRWSLMNRGWQRVLIQVNLALMLVMGGFDLMGLLVLHMR